jgi:hypothetical protein
MSLVCTTASPFNCYWIAAGSEKRVGDYAYAVCQRSRGHDRIVNEADCARCPLWREPADDVKEIGSFPQGPMTPVYWVR